MAGRNVKPLAPMIPSGTLSESEQVRDRLVRLAYRFLWDPDDAEDVVHDALAIAYDRQGSLRDRDKWWPWICRIVVHHCFDWRRRKLRRRRHEAAAAKPIDASSSDEPGGRTELRELVMSLLHRLPRRQREVVVLRNLQEATYDEIAEILGMSAATARVHARQARERLATWLEKTHPELCEEAG